MPISGNLINQISDHFPNFIVIKNGNENKVTKAIHYKRNMKNYNPIIFTNDLRRKFKETNYQNQNTNELSTNIVNTFTSSLEYLAPMEKISKKEANNKHKPWFTQGIWNSIKIKTRWLKKFLKAKNTAHYTYN